ncbi:hypothetical protein DFH09DRAFT_1431983 [Mycena vulgaris]|nr:hypothetical protein DFH09DRAFT_1431983 [Mycena vulgaris]
MPTASLCDSALTPRERYRAATPHGAVARGSARIPRYRRGRAQTQVHQRQHDRRARRIPHLGTARESTTSRAHAHRRMLHGHPALRTRAGSKRVWASAGKGGEEEQWERGEQEGREASAEKQGGSRCTPCFSSAMPHPPASARAYAAFVPRAARRYRYPHLASSAPPHLVSPLPHPARARARRLNTRAGRARRHAEAFTPHPIYGTELSVAPPPRHARSYTSAVARGGLLALHPALRPTQRANPPRQRTRGDPGRRINDPRTGARAQEVAADARVRAGTSTTMRGEGDGFACAGMWEEGRGKGEVRGRAPGRWNEGGKGTRAKGRRKQRKGNKEGKEGRREGTKGRKGRQKGRLILRASVCVVKAGAAVDVREPPPLPPTYAPPPRLGVRASRHRPRCGSHSPSSRCGYARAEVLPPYVQGDRRTGRRGRACVVAREGQRQCAREGRGGRGGRAEGERVHMRYVEERMPALFPPRPTPAVRGLDDLRERGLIQRRCDLPRNEGGTLESRKRRCFVVGRVRHPARGKGGVGGEVRVLEAAGGGRAASDFD